MNGSFGIAWQSLLSERTSTQTSGKVSTLSQGKWETLRPPLLRWPTTVFALMPIAASAPEPTDGHQCERCCQAKAKSWSLIRPWKTTSKWLWKGSFPPSNVWGRGSALSTMCASDLVSGRCGLWKNTLKASSILPTCLPVRKQGLGT